MDTSIYQFRTFPKVDLSDPAVLMRAEAAYKWHEHIFGGTGNGLEGIPREEITRELLLMGRPARILVGPTEEAHARAKAADPRPRGRSVFHSAVVMEQIHLIPPALITRDLLRMESGNYDTALHRAVKTGQFGLIPQRLITHEALTHLNGVGDTPFDELARRNRLWMLDPKFLNGDIKERRAPDGVSNPELSTSLGERLRDPAGGVKAPEAGCEIGRAVEMSRS